MKTFPASRKRYLTLALAVSLLPALSACAGGAAVSTSSSPSSSTNATTASATSSEDSSSKLPNGLLSAHANVYWEDSAACQAFDLQKVRVHLAKKKVISLVAGKDYHRAVGCLDGFAVITSSTDLGENAVNHGDIKLGQDYPDLRAGDLLISLWNGSGWDINIKDQGLESIPSLRRTLGTEPQTSLAAATSALKKRGANLQDATQLIGPNAPTWRHDSGSSWAPFDSKFFTGEIRKDWHLADNFSEQGIRPGGIVGVYDQFGANVFGVSFIEVNTLDGDQSKECGVHTNYTVLDTAPTLLKSNGKALNVALVRYQESGKKSLVDARLIPASAPTNGSKCDIPYFIQIGKNWVNAELKSRVGLESDQEVKAYKESFEWQDATHFAQSLRSK